MPVEEPVEMDLTHVGGTPLQLSRRYADTFGYSKVYIKDERYGPTGSFKDRQATIAVAAMAQAGMHECVIASTGNAAVAYAAACARAGIKLWVFMTSLVPQDKLRETALFGAEVVKVSGTYDQTKQIAQEFAKRRGLFLDRGAHNIPARESMKTIAYEIVEQLGWRAPDWYIQAVSGGLGPLGVHHGFRELYEMGLIDRIPKIAVIQAEGCAPMVRAFKAGREKAQPVVPETRIAILSTGDPGKTYTYLYRLLTRTGGTMECVEDAEAFRSMLTLAKVEGTAVEPAAAVAFAGLEKMIRHDKVTADEIVVVNCTGHTFPVEKHVLGDQWRVDISLGEEAAVIPREGLVSALGNLDEKTTTVLIVDDNPDDALLIRRFLEARKSYRVFHASDPIIGLEEAKQRLPDLIILDLTMPGMDGFSFLDQLKRDKRTESTPVIVVSAKDINEADLERLNGRIEGLYQKGSLPVQSFVNQVVQVIEQSNPGIGKDAPTEDEQK
ncbi:MAG TPA: pyridoxal-phosphate dependent enzyme [Anaerolineaceae bacterium]|nr:pyridoxal-phosphate dependent enzyme [Anaerolineaceae bacterium]